MKSFIIKWFHSIFVLNKRIFINSIKGTMNSFKIHGSSIKSLSNCELYMFLYKSYISVILIEMTLFASSFSQDMINVKVIL